MIKLGGGLGLVVGCFGLVGSNISIFVGPSDLDGDNEGLSDEVGFDDIEGLGDNKRGIEGLSVVLGSIDTVGS